MMRSDVSPLPQSKVPVVLVVGSLHHDIMIEAANLPRRDETAVGSRWYPKFGGKGGNQAVAAAHAGVAARMLGAVGDDGFGRFMLEALDTAGVARHFVSVLSGVGSGMSVAIQDAAGDYAAAIVSGANLGIDPAALSNDELWNDVRVLVLQNEVRESLNIAAAEEARRRGIRVILNAAPARKLDDALRRAVDLLIVNAVEAEMMGSSSVTDLQSALHAAQVLAAGTSDVVVTAGANGLAAWSVEKGGFTVAAVKVKAVSAHGAGDCFTGTLAASLARGQGLEAACRAASTAAAVHVAGMDKNPQA